MTGDVTTPAYETGRDVLGPIVLKYLGLLSAYTRFRAEESSRLYVARAGVRIEEMMDRYRSAGGEAAPDGRVFWGSRLLVAKGVFRQAPNAAGELIAREYAGQDIADVLRGMWRYEPAWAAQVHDGPSLGPAESFADWVATSRTRLARSVRDYFAQYESMYQDYVAALVDGRPRVVLIDSGWQGTIHRLMSQAPPPREYQSLLFGRVLRESEPRSHASDVVGLILEEDRYRPDRPETAFILHRHLIESLFEVDVPSAEVLRRSSGGSVESPSASADIPASESPLVRGVMDHITEHATISPADRFASASTAMRRLAEMIASPTRNDVEALTVPPRSADFGRELAVAVVSEPAARFEGDTAEQRIADALWQQGQVALEYEGAAAALAGRQLAESLTARSYFAAPRRRPGGLATEFEAHGNPVVSIVTRTKDRPVLLRRAAASVAAQTFRNYHWVVVNDGGAREDVIAVLEAAGVEQDKITLVSNTASVGMEAASNLGVSAAESDFVVIHDDDDSWDPSFLEHTVGFLNGGDGLNYGGVVTRSVYVSEEILGEDVVIHGTRSYNATLRVVKLSDMAVGNLFPPISFVFRRSVYDKIGGFDEDLPVLGDWDFNLRFLALGDIAVLPVELAYYHHRDVGSAGTYGNSVLAGRDIHGEYDAILRNRMARTLSNDTVALMSAIGEMRKALENELHRVASAGPESRGDQPSSDDLWVALTAIGHSGRIMNRSSRLTRYVNGIMRKVFGVKTGMVVEDMDGFARELLTTIDPVDVPVAPDFDEQAYLEDNPDVRAVVLEGGFRSGYHHFLTHGRYEGRPRPRRGS